MTLQAKLDKLKKDFESTAPKPALEIMHRATHDLEASGILDKTVKVGDRAPAFTLDNSDGQPVSLSGLLRNGP
ncbi:MAG: AhpC/TSA family protein, partial [Deltaproteobacteria bacterium]|nr:AhpC/TSA family protein [Deltaproteobacteria bacterium]